MDGIARMSSNLSNLVDDIVSVCGIERHSVVMGGFSQGGHIALHSVYGHQCSVRAVFALGSFLCQDSNVYKQIKNRSSSSSSSASSSSSSSPSPSLPALFLSHGDQDGLVRPGWVVETKERFEGN